MAAALHTSGTHPVKNSVAASSTPQGLLVLLGACPSKIPGWTHVFAQQLHTMYWEVPLGGVPCAVLIEPTCARGTLLFSPALARRMISLQDDSPTSHGQALLVTPQATACKPAHTGHFCISLHVFQAPCSGTSQNSSCIKGQACTHEDMRQG